MSDKQILKLIKQVNRTSDAVAANALVKRYYREMLGFVFNRVKDKEVAMDVTQEIFVSMLKSLVSFEAKKASFRTWLYVIAHRRVADYYRELAKENPTVFESEDTGGLTANNQTYVYQQIEISEIKQFILTLEQPKRRIFEMKIYDDLTFKEISAQLEIPEATVKTSFYATQKLIRKEFKEDG